MSTDIQKLTHNYCYMCMQINVNTEIVMLINHICISLIIGPKSSICPTSWRHRADSCYRLSDQAFNSRQDASDWCKTKVTNSTLATVTSAFIRKDVSDIIGPSDKEKSIWVDKCTNGAYFYRMFPIMQSINSIIS